jgi:hypothetical protein
MDPNQDAIIARLRAKTPNMVGGMPSSVPGTPGVGGAMEDLMDAIRKTFAGRGARERESHYNDIIDTASGK